MCGENGRNENPCSWCFFDCINHFCVCLMCFADGATCARIVRRKSAIFAICFVKMRQNCVWRLFKTQASWNYIRLCPYPNPSEKHSIFAHIFFDNEICANFCKKIPHFCYTENCFNIFNLHF